VSGKAFHDIGHKSLNLEMKKKAVRELSRQAKVFISSEGRLPRELEKYRMALPPEQIHSALYYASLYFGEGATTASECVVLGTPAIYISDLSLGYTEDEEKAYGALFNFAMSADDQRKAIGKGIELLRDRNVKRTWGEKREEMLRETIDVTAFMIQAVKDHLGGPRS